MAAAQGLAVPGASCWPVMRPRWPTIAAAMPAPITATELLKGNLSAHTPMMAQYQRVTFQAA
jgi:hypothetical protein